MKQSTGSELSVALRACRGAFLGIAVMTGVLNVLYLTGSFFMLEIYDRVLPSRSIPTLVGLAVLALILYAFQGVLDLIRGRVLVRIGASLDQALEFPGLRRPRAPLAQDPHLQMVCSPCAISTRCERFSRARARPLLRSPWMPLYLGICFLFHPWIGFAATFGGLSWSASRSTTEARTRKPVKEASGFGSPAQRPGGGQPAQCRSPRCHGHGAAPCGRLARGQRQIHGMPPRAADVAGGLSASRRCSAWCSSPPCSGSAPIW